jgi:predicted TIM-barrel fold metal-dependent hydrolase
MAYEIKRFPYSGTIDADGHVLEPPDLWKQYLENEYKDRAIRIRLDEEGYEYLEVDGRPSSQAVKGTLALMGAMGDENLHPSPDRRYAETMPFGAGSAAERLEMMDRENLECCVLYPTLGLLWEIEVDDPKLSLAYARAYNRWIADFCRSSRGRLVPIAHLTMLDPEGSAVELERAVKDGCKGAWVNAYNPRRVIHGNSIHEPLFKKCCELDVPLAIHPAFTIHRAAAGIFDWPVPGHGNADDAPVKQRTVTDDGAGGVGWGDALWGRAIVQQALISFMALGTFDRFPKLKLGVLEEGAGWIGSALDRIDAFVAAIDRHRTRPRASEYFRRQCFISGDPDEFTTPFTIDYVGADCFMWATDFPHPDHPHDWVDNLQRYVAPLSPTTRAKVLGENVKRIYHLDYELPTSSSSSEAA